MDKSTTKYFLFFLIGFFILSFISVAIYQNIFGNSKSYVLDKAKKRFNDNQSAWESLFDLCSKININNKSKDLCIRYYINQKRIECDDKTVKDNNGEIIENWNMAYPNFFTLMKNLDIGYATIKDNLYTFSLRSMPGKTCLIVYLASSEDINDLPRNRKWEYRLKDCVYIVQMKE